VSLSLDNSYQPPAMVLTFVFCFGFFGHILTSTMYKGTLLISSTSGIVHTYEVMGLLQRTKMKRKW